MHRREFARAVLGTIAYAAIAGCSRQLPPPHTLRAPRSFLDTCDAITAIINADRANALVSAAGIPRLYHHGKRTRRAVLLFHGFTNCPQQFDELARELHGDGYNVYVPRIPFHGYADRMTHATEGITATLLQQTAEDAFGLVAGLGEEVAVMGLSLGGTMTLWLAQTQRFARAIPIAPFLMPVQLSHGVGDVAMGVLHAAPDAYMWWDPDVKQNTRPLYAYPGYMTHALAEIVFLGDAVFARARSEAPRVASCTFVANTRDNAVRQEVADELIALWSAHGATVNQLTFADIGQKIHDIIDLTNLPEAKRNVYPTLRHLIASP